MLPEFDATAANDPNTWDPFETADDWLADERIEGSDSWLMSEQDVIVRQYEIMDALLSGLGGGACPVEIFDNSYQYVMKHRLTIDGVPFDLDGKYKHLREVYEDEHPRQRLMASAQSGKSARLMAHMARTLGVKWGGLIGYYFPDMHLAPKFSRDRFKPFMRSNHLLAEHLGAARVGERGSGKGSDATLTMSWGETTLFFMTIGGRTSTEGLPLGAVYFDEVRRMDMRDIERAQERYSAQAEPIDFMVSTAKYPDSDIHHYFLEGDQRYFHTACGCPDGIVLALTFPNCILDMRTSQSSTKKKVAHAFEHAGMRRYGMTEAERAQFYEACYFCPKCSEIIVDPRLGWWEAHAPGNYTHSWQLPQMLSWTYPAGRILHKFEHVIDRDEFNNSTLGLPSVDLEKMPVRLSHVQACVDTSLTWGERMSNKQRKRRMVNTSMGVDIQAGYSIAVIKKRAPNGKHRTVHVEVVEHPESGNHWRRIGELMDRYDVLLGIVDEAPDFTASLNFARAFHGRVWLQNYALGDTNHRNVSWEDPTLKKDKKQKGSTAFKYRVSMKRTVMLHWGCMRWVERANEFPDPHDLIQMLPKQGGKPKLTAHLRIGIRQPTMVVKDLYMEHMTRWVFKEVVPEGPRRQEALARGKIKRVAEWVKEDPHFSHADMWASVALSRISGKMRVTQAS